MKKNLSRFLLTSLLLTQISLNAFDNNVQVYNENEYSYDNNQEYSYENNLDYGYGNNQNFSINAEVLFLKPSTDQASFVIESDSANVIRGNFYPNGKRHLATPNYRLGYRADLLYTLCDCSKALNLRFTYFNAKHSKSVVGNFLADTIGFPGDGAQDVEDIYYSGRASIHNQYRYLAGDLTLNRLSFDCFCDNLFFLVGLHYANIKHSTHLSSIGALPTSTGTRAVNNDYRTHSDFWGIGPQIGIDYNYDLYKNCNSEISLHANMRSALLCSDSHATLQARSLRTDPSEVSLKNDHLWRVTPAFDAKLGATYQFSLFCLDGSLELGYEWIWVHNSVNTIRGIDVAFPGDTIDVYSNLNLHGPYVRVGVDF